MGSSGALDEPLLERLSVALGRNALALDVAGRRLRKIGRGRWPRVIDQVAGHAHDGQVFGDLRLPGEEQRESSVEAALHLSYRELPPLAQERLRALGSFAPAAVFGAAAAAGVWGCSTDETWEQLDALVDLGLLSRLEEAGQTRWRQHTLLR